MTISNIRKVVAERNDSETASDVVRELKKLYGKQPDYTDGQMFVAYLNVAK